MAKAGGKAPQDQTHWDRYWHADRVSACLADVVTHNYGATTRASWEAFFEALPRGARLLDIGTGNGAVALIASEIGAAGDKQFEIHGVDRADIDPVRFVKNPSPALKTIRFHGCTSSEALPFPAAHFDAVSGQYALEYTNLTATLAELRRVTKPGAQLRFVLHGSEAAPAVGAARDLEDIAFLIDELDLLNKARSLMRAAFGFEYASAYDPGLEARARNARESYLAAAQRADARYAAAGCKPMFNDLLAGIRSAWDRRRELTLDYILEGIDAIETEMRAHAARLREMRHAALSRNTLDALENLFRQCSFESVSSGQLVASENDRLLGWYLIATRGNAT